MGEYYTISRFHGIEIKMSYKDDYPPFVEATVNYDKKPGIFSIESGNLIDVINGDPDDFPFKEEGLVTAWIVMNKKALLDNWNSISVKSRPLSIEGL